MLVTHRVYWPAMINDLLRIGAGESPVPIATRTPALLSCSCACRGRWPYIILHPGNLIEDLQYPDLRLLHGHIWISHIICSCLPWAVPGQKREAQDPHRLLGWVINSYWSGRKPGRIDCWWDECKVLPKKQTWTASLPPPSSAKIPLKISLLPNPCADHVNTLRQTQAAHSYTLGLALSSNGSCLVQVIAPQFQELNRSKERPLHCTSLNKHQPPIMAIELLNVIDHCIPFVTFVNHPLSIQQFIPQLPQLDVAFREHPSPRPAVGPCGLRPPWREAHHNGAAWRRNCPKTAGDFGWFLCHGLWVQFMATYLCCSAWKHELNDLTVLSMVADFSPWLPVQEIPSFTDCLHVCGLLLLVGLAWLLMTCRCPGLNQRHQRLILTTAPWPVTQSTHIRWNS